MRAEQFLTCLRNAMPSRSTLEEYGLDNDEIEEVQATFLGTARKPVSTNIRDELVRLVLEFDCSKVEVGLVRFLGEPQRHMKGMRVAYCEAESIVLNKDGVVVLCDDSGVGSNDIQCASDSRRFLEGLCIFIEIRRNKSEWKGKVEDAAVRCARAAGGPQFAEFFRILCAFLR